MCDEEGILFWTEIVGRADFSRARFLVDFSVSQENDAQLAFLDTLSEIEPAPGASSPEAWAPDIGRP